MLWVAQSCCCCCIVVAVVVVAVIVTVAVAAAAVVGLQSGPLPMKPSDKELTLRVFVDHSMVEAIAQVSQPFSLVQFREFMGWGQCQHADWGHFNLESLRIEAAGCRDASCVMPHDLPYPFHMQQLIMSFGYIYVCVCLCVSVCVCVFSSTKSTYLQTLG